MHYDIIIVGGGPAGLSAALLLGRCRRRVLVIDAGRQRNRFSREMHGYLSRDGIAPAKLLSLGRAEIERYGVAWRAGQVTDARAIKGGFRIALHGGRTLTCRKLVLATGLRDRLPDLEGIEPLYGRSVHHCPYCDGYEWRDRALAVYGRGAKALGLALSLTTWSRDVIALPDGPMRLTSTQHAQLRQAGIALDARPIARLEGARGRLRRIVFRDGDFIQRDALFFNTGSDQASDLARRLGCAMKKNGGICTDRRERTGIPGLFLIGDASKDVQFAIVAAAEGATAAAAINRELQEQEGRAAR